MNSMIEFQSSRGRWNMCLLKGRLVWTVDKECPASGVVALVVPGIAKWDSEAYCANEIVV
jgi:hypothetical protein